jgi:hypothetical protein
MDRDITVRFYEIVSAVEGAAPVEDILDRLAGDRKRRREVDVGDGIVLRLEHLERDGALRVGDITRVQTDNLPGHVTDDDTARLPVDEIGHNVAFVYDPDTRCIALQFDTKIGVGRITRYLSHFGRRSSFSHMPILRQDALDRFERETPKKLTLRVASVRNFRNLGNERTDFEDQLETWGRLFGAPSIEITVSTRGNEDGLHKGRVVNTIRRWLRMRDEIDGVAKITGETIESDEGFNFIKYLLKERETLDLPRNDPAEGRRIRLRYVKGSYDEHRGYLRDIADAD